MNTFSSIRSGSSIISIKKVIKKVVSNGLINLYVCGYYSSNPVTIYNSNGSTLNTLSNTGGNDVFISKYNGDGSGQWAVHISGTGNENPVKFLVDNSNNVYITGYYNSDLTFYHSNNTVFATTLTNIGNNDIFVSKYNKDGSCQWVTSIKGTSDDFPADIKIDNSNNIFIYGYYNSTSIQIYSSNATLYTTLNNLGTYNIFIAKYNNSGTVQWVSQIGGSGNVLPINSVYNWYLGYGTNINVPVNIVLSKTNDVYLCGYYYSNPLTISNSNGSVFKTLDNSGNNDVFIVKYHSNGFAKWCSRIGGGGIESPVNLVIDDLSNIYINGIYYSSNPLRFYNSNDSVFSTLTDSTNNYNIFIAKYNTDGSGQWTTRISGSNEERPVQMILDLSNNIYITGYYKSSSLILNSSDNSLTNTLSNTGNHDMFTAKYSNSGILQWGMRAATINADIPSSILVDNDNNLYISGACGFFNYDVGPTKGFIAYNSDQTIFSQFDNVGGSLNASNNYVQTNAGDAFLLKYNSNGTGQWLSRIGGQYNDGAVNICLDVNNYVYVSGNYVSKPIDIYNSNGTIFTSLNNDGTATRPWTNGNIYIVKYNKDGSAQWGTRIGGSSIDNVIDMAIK